MRIAANGFIPERTKISNWFSCVPCGHTAASLPKAMRAFFAIARFSVSSAFPSAAAAFWMMFAGAFASRRRCMMQGSGVGTK